MAEELEIAQSLRAAGVAPGDTVMVHGDAGVAAQLRSVPRERQLDRLIAQMVAYFGDEGTLVVPAFSYSFTKGEPFDPQRTPSDVGQFSEHFRRRAGALRSRHPIFSVAATGRHAQAFAQSKIDDSFGEDTAFDLLHRLGGLIVCLGCDVSTITFVHYVEQRVEVPYRYMKSFRGQLVDCDTQREITCTYYVRDTQINSQCDLALLERAALAKGRAYLGEFGRFPLFVISTEMFALTARELLQDNPYALIAAGGSRSGDMKFDHIGLFVKDLRFGREHLSRLLPIVKESEEFHDRAMRVSVQFLSDADGLRYELVAPNGEGGPVDGVLGKADNFLHHVAYRVGDLDAQMAAYRNRGCMPLGKPMPAVAFAGARVAFFLTPLRLIIELIESDGGTG